ncbi:MAG: hypothetical protein R3D69_00145 [Xanthobacteraceae bacterium]
MARIVLTVGGYVLGNLLLPGLGGAIGGLVGGYVGGIVDQQLFGGTASKPSTARACRICACSRRATAP